MSKIRNIFICHRHLLIFRRDAIWHDSVMSACDNMEKKAATDVRKLGKRCLLVRWSNVEEVDHVIINISNRLIVDACRQGKGGK